MQHQRNAIISIINYSIFNVLSRNILPASCPIIFEISIIVFGDLYNSKNSSEIQNYYEYKAFKSASLLSLTEFYCKASARVHGNWEHNLNLLNQLIFIVLFDYICLTLTPVQGFTIIRST